MNGCHCLCVLMDTVFFLELYRKLKNARVPQFRPGSQNERLPQFRSRSQSERKPSFAQEVKTESSTLNTLQPTLISTKAICYRCTTREAKRSIMAHILDKESVSSQTTFRKGQARVDEITPLVVARFMEEFWVLFGNRRLKALRSYQEKGFWYFSKSSPHQCICQGFGCIIMEII